MGWNGSSGSRIKSGKRNPFKSTHSLAFIPWGIAFCLLAGILLWLLFSVDKNETAIKKESTEPMSRGRISIENPDLRENPKLEDKVRQVDARQIRRDMLKGMTPEQRIKFLFEEAEKSPIDLTPATNRAYATGTEQVLDWVFTTNLGDIPPILPSIPIFEEAHLVEILANKNKILETDDAATQDGKETVKLAKEELIKFISEGGTAKEFLAYYHDQLRQAHMQFKETQQSVFKLVREEPELAAEYLKEVNERLAEKGIKPVIIPRAMAERFGIELD